MADKKTKPPRRKTRAEKIKETGSSELKQRVINAKAKLPKGSGKSLFLHYYPEYGTVKKSSRVDNVFYLRIADKDITEKLEQLVDKLQNK